MYPTSSEDDMVALATFMKISEEGVCPECGSDRMLESNHFAFGKFIECMECGFKVYSSKSHFE